MTIFPYMKGHENKAYSSKKWREIENKWKKKHPILSTINKIWEFFYYPIYRTWSDLTDVPRQIKWFFQRGFRGWSDNQSWGWYYHNAKLNVGVLKHLKKHKHGHPSLLEESGKSFDETIQEWDKILDDMIYAFNCVVEDDEGRFEIFTPSRDNPNEHCLGEDFAKEYKVILQSKKEYERMQKGFQYYIKYYQSLWD